MRIACWFAALGIFTFGFAHGEEFDRLSPADRETFAARWEKEVWPILTKGGKESCTACHAKGGKAVTDLRFSGDARKDYAKLLKDGYLIANDPGSLLERIKTTHPDRKMPPGKRDRVPADEVKILESFINDLEAKQAKEAKK